MKNQALFFSKDKSKKLKCRLLQFLFGALRVIRKYTFGYLISIRNHTFGYLILVRNHTFRYLILTRNHKINKESYLWN